MARGLLGQYSPIQPRQKRGEALKEADVVILAGICFKFKGHLSNIQHVHDTDSQIYIQRSPF